jgi:hypothetical protein
VPYYGQLNHILLLRIPAIDNTEIDSLRKPSVIALAVINRLKITRLFKAPLQICQVGGYQSLEVVDVNTVKCLVARVPWANQWFVFDRTSSSSRNVEEFPDF